MTPDRGSFDPDIRVLACEHCGAPLAVATQATRLVCRFCNADNHLDLPRSLPPAPPISSQERLRRLAAQVGAMAPAPVVAEFLDGRKLAAWRGQEALAAWIDLRRAQRSGGDALAEARFFQLTRVLSDASSEGGDGLRRRALLETGVEAARLPRHRTYLAATLARHAALAGELRAASGWLDRCEAESDDLEAAGAVGVARALVARAENRVGDVSDALTIDGVPMPLAVELYPQGTLLLADALERTSRLEEAVSTLDAFVSARWPCGRSELAMTRVALGGDPCTIALPLLDERRGLRAEAERRFHLPILLLFVSLYAALAVLGAVFLARGESLGWLAALVLGGGVAVFILVAVYHEVRDRKSWQSPLWATIERVEGGSSGKDADTGGAAVVVLDGEPERTQRIAFERGALEPGMRVQVRRTWFGPRWLP